MSDEEKLVTILSPEPLITLEPFVSLIKKLDDTQRTRVLTAREELLATLGLSEDSWLGIEMYGMVAGEAVEGMMWEERRSWVSAQDAMVMEEVAKPLGGGTVWTRVTELPTKEVSRATVTTYHYNPKGGSGEDVGFVFSQPDDGVVRVEKYSAGSIERLVEATKQRIMAE
ncbi:MAG: hypothetical protein WCV93_05660 [Candidatus Shapirobacteria bacterium]|jgi:hypothetical protein